MPPLPTRTVDELATTQRSNMSFQLLDSTDSKHLGNFVNAGESREKMLSIYGNAIVEHTEKCKMWIIAYVKQ